MSDHKPVINVTRGTVVCEEAILADRPLARMRGLLGRQSLHRGEGLLLLPAPSVHTAFMRFPIDVVFLDRESVVVKIVEALAPWRAASAPRARSVLELPAGEAARRGITVGDWLIRVIEDFGWDEADTGVPGARPALPELLLVSRDRRFRAVMAVLLSARGFSVTPSACYPDAEAAAQVVIIDPWESLARAEMAAAEAGLMTPGRKVVFVSDSEETATSGAPVLSKWGSLERMCDEIASARALDVERR